MPSFTQPHPALVLADTIIRTVQGRQHLPPRWLRDVGPGDFEATGREFLDLFIKLAQLQPAEKVLDIGCGCGRMALPMTGYLSQMGFYMGMDITPAVIDWCRRHITRRYPHFQFMHIDLYNQRYNPGGRYQAPNYIFPFKAESFDFIFLTSIFTHMLPAGVERYLHEIARLLSQKGRAFITVFLLNEVQQTLANLGVNDIDFKYGSGSYRLRSETVPESAVAYDEAFLRSLLPRCGLTICEPVHYGSWSGRAKGLSYQDILLVQRHA